MHGCHKNEWLPQKYSLWKLYCFCVCVLVAQLYPTLCESMDFVHQSSLSMEFSRQEYWSGLPFPSLGDLPDPGIKPTCLTSPALAGRFFTTSATWEALQNVFVILIIIWNYLDGLYASLFTEP